MARKKTQIEKDVLVTEIAKLEEANTYSSYNILFSALAETSWAKEHGYSANVLRTRAKEYELTLKTPVGKRGRKPAPKTEASTVKTE